MLCFWRTESEIKTTNCVMQKGKQVLRSYRIALLVAREIDYCVFALEEKLVPRGEVSSQRRT